MARLGEAAVDEASVDLPARVARVRAATADARAPTDLRLANLARVFDAVTESGTLSRSDVSRRTGLGIPTVHRLVSELCDRGLLEEHEAPDESRLGRPPVVYRVPRRAVAIAGADVGNETMRLAVIDAGGNVRARSAVPTAEGGRDLAGSLVSELKRLLRAAGVPIRNLSAFGIGVAAAVDPDTGALRDPPLHRHWDGLQLAAALGVGLGCEGIVAQDDHLAALAENSEIGSAPGATPLLVLDVGKGIGMGLTLDSAGIAGARGRLGRIATWPVHTVPSGWPAATTLGQALVGDGLVRTYRAFGGAAPVVDGVTLAAAARSGDGAALDVLTWAAEEIAEILSRVCTLIDPEAVVLGGGLAAGAHDLLAPSIAQRLGPVARRVVPSVLGSGAVLAGALLAAEKTAATDLRRRLAAGDAAPKRSTSAAA